LAVRAALGAGRARLVRQLLVESGLLALGGGALGMLVAAWGVRLLPALKPGSLPRLADIRIHPEVFLFALLLSLATGLLVGLVPAWRLSRTELHETLKQGGRSESASGSGRLRQSLVVAEVGISLCLLAGAGLLIRSFARLVAVDPGFTASSVTAADIALPKAKYDTPAKLQAFWGEVRERAAALPGVRQAGLVDALPFNHGGVNGDILFADRPKPRAGEAVTGEKRVVSPGYFETLKVPLLRGRTFSREDNGREPVVVINDNLARYAWPGQDPLGKRLSWGGEEGWMRVVGVVGNVRQYALDDKPTLDTYIPCSQVALSAMTLAVSARAGSTASLPGELRRLVRELDPGQPVASVRPMPELVADSYAQRRFNMLLLGALAALALVLAGAGIFSVVSYSVEQRVREIGMRVAIGASRRDVLALVVGGVLRLVIIGIAAGLAASLVLARLIESLLFAVKSSDPVAYAGAAVLLLALALLAAYLPARQAMEIDPMEALRYG
ncbi:MAG: FtsX-like permease family protein, partial [Acidobacteriota bacterium]|nr:FtsX-like permease family protein [Acidobacteriota bacterium]